MSWADHQAFGKELKELDSRLGAISIDLQGRYGITSVAGKAAKNAAKHITDLRFALDVVVERDCPSISEVDLKRCYRA